VKDGMCGHFYFFGESEQTRIGGRLCKFLKDRI
jgi:hypothetical protein